MTVLLIDYSFKSYRLMIRDDKTKELYVWRRMNIVFHKKLSKKLENKLIQRAWSSLSLCVR